jgi:hypothetical protein
VTRLDGAPVAAGTQTWSWDGRNADGVLLPRGTYTSFVSASDGVRAVSQAVRVEMNAFAIAVSTGTPKRGTSLSVSVTSAEPLSSGIYVFVTQSGLATYGVNLTKVDSRTYKGTIKLRTGGSSGTVTLRVKGIDLDGRVQYTSRTLPLS